MRKSSLSASYLFRLDDICPTMDWDSFHALETIFNRYGIKPIIGIIPDNHDPKLGTHPARPDFWEYMRRLSENGWIIAQHGYRHEYVNKAGGILDINKQSEFADLPYEEQYRKIRTGKEILERNLGTEVRWWMAPAHSFDATTCRALVDLGFTHVTDGIALFPFRKHGLIWVPQQLWKPRRKLFGTWTVCIHPNSCRAADLKALERFIQKNQKSCILSEGNTHDNPLLSILNRTYSSWWNFQYLIYKTFFK